MVVGIVQIKIYTPWVHSLKEKRMVVKSICAKVRNKYNVSIAEVDEQDIHQFAAIGFACIAGEAAHADSICDTVLNYIEANTEGEIVQVDRQMF